MGLAYFFLFIMILGTAGTAVTLLVLAWIIWKNLVSKSFQSSLCFGCALRCCSILLIGNRLERAALGVPFLIG